jgi:hypothetical protein
MSVSERSTNIAIGRRTQRDENDFRIDLDDPAHQVLHLPQNGDVVIARLAQPILQDAGAHDVLIHDQNAQRGLSDGSVFGHRQTGVAMAVPSTGSPWRTGLAAPDAPH